MNDEQQLAAAEVLDDARHDQYREKRKVIKFDLPPTVQRGSVCIVPVLVDWFPPRTPDEHLANWAAREAGEPEPFPNQNLIEIEVTLL